MKLTKDEENVLKQAIKHKNQGITNNQTFNDSSHNNGGSLEPTGSSLVWTQEKKQKKDKKT